MCIPTFSANTGAHLRRRILVCRVVSACATFEDVGSNPITPLRQNRSNYLLRPVWFLFLFFKAAVTTRGCSVHTRAADKCFMMDNYWDSSATDSRVHVLLANSDMLLRCLSSLQPIFVPAVLPSFPTAPDSDWTNEEAVVKPLLSLDVSLPKLSSIHCK